MTITAKGADSGRYLGSVTLEIFPVSVAGIKAPENSAFTGEYWQIDSFKVPVDPAVMKLFNTEFLLRDSLSREGWVPSRTDRSIPVAKGYSTKAYDDALAQLPLKDSLIQVGADWKVENDPRLIKKNRRYGTRSPEELAAVLQYATMWINYRIGSAHYVDKETSSAVIERSEAFVANENSRNPFEALRRQRNAEQLELAKKGELLLNSYHNNIIKRMTLTDQWEKAPRTVPSGYDISNEDWNAHYKAYHEFLRVNNIPSSRTYSEFNYGYSLVRTNAFNSIRPYMPLGVPCSTNATVVTVMMDILGVDNATVVDLDPTGPHEWVRVRMDDGKWYHTTDPSIPFLN